MEDVKHDGLKERTVNGFFYSAGIAAAYILKHYYSMAGSDDLLWILGPVARLVQCMGQMGFSYEPHAGFVSRDCHILIAPACAGINLLIVSFTMAIFTGIRHMDDVKKKILWCCFSGVAAYGLVVFVNAVRIYLSVIVFSSNIESGWMTPARCHRLLGVLVYFFFHCLFYFAVKQLALRCGSRVIGFEKQQIGVGLMPLGWYVGITIVVPFVNAAYRNNMSQFVEHGLFVVSVSAMIWGVLLLVNVSLGRLLKTWR